MVISHGYVVPTPEGWVTKNRVGEVVDQLEGLGWDLTFVGVRSAPRPYLTHTLSEGIRVEAAVSERRRPWKLLRTLGRVLRAIRSADAVLVFMPTVRTAVALVLLGPRAVMYSGAAFAVRPGTPAWRRRLEGLAARRAAAVVAHGEQLRAHFEPLARRVELTVPMVAEEVGVRMHERTRPDPKERGRLRILYVGSVRPDKGVPELLDALEGLPEAECRVVGPIADQGLGERLAQLAGSSDRLTAYPYLDWPELRECFSWANVLVLPSHSEGFPRVVYEATAFGLALVVTPVGGIPHRLHDGQEAAFFPVGDVEALERTLNSLASDPAKAERLAAGALDALAPVFSEPHPSRQFARELEAVGRR